MDKIRISKVENVEFQRAKEKAQGVLHLTSHHLIFSLRLPPSQDRCLNGSKDATVSAPARPCPKEIWMTYPMIYSCTFRPTSHVSSIFIRCRDFTFSSLHFLSESQARDVYETIKSLSCNLNHIQRLYAFSYTPQSPERELNGWDIYSFQREMDRMKVVESGLWRISRLNEKYDYIDTYPAHFAVPASIADSTLRCALAYRSRHRIPVLTYLHSNNCSLTRSSQPMTGLGRGNRNLEDETLVLTIFETTCSASGFDEPRQPDAVLSNDTGVDDGAAPRTTSDEGSTDQVDPLAVLRTDSVERSDLLRTQRRVNLIVDARPRLNAMVNHAIGRGSENMENYRHAVKTYLGIANIHVMRNSLMALCELLRVADAKGLTVDPIQLAKTNWLVHMATLMEGTDTITRQIGLKQAHVLLHCSDGWDRTSQLSALSQLCLDPYYRTIEGFMVLVEKDWLSFGHRFHHRTGFMGDGSWFEIEKDWGTNAAGGPSNPIDNVFSHVKAFFNSRTPDSRDPADSDDEYLEVAGWWPEKSSSSTKLDEISPIFHQFLDGTYQLMYQHPTRFEFNERFLRRLLYHVYSCQYGTFLYNSEKERVEDQARERTRSVWDYFLSRRRQFVNSEYSPETNDPTKGRGPMIFFNTEKGPRWWSGLFGRPDDEMNGPVRMKRHASGSRSDLAPMNLGPLIKMAGRSVLGQSGSEHRGGGGPLQNTTAIARAGRKMDGRSNHIPRREPARESPSQPAEAAVDSHSDVPTRPADGGDGGGTSMVTLSPPLDVTSSGDEREREGAGSFQDFVRRSNSLQTACSRSESGSKIASAAASVAASPADQTSAGPASPERDVDPLKEDADK